MKYLNLSIIAAAAVFMAACKNDITPSPVDPGNVPQVKSITANGTKYADLSYNDKGQLISFKYAGSNNVGGGSREDKFSYNTSGNLTKAVNLVDSTQYTYSADGRLQQSDTYTEWRLSNNGSGMNFRKTYAYNANGKIASVTASDGNKSTGQTQRYKVTFDYNANGALSGMTYNDGDSNQKFVVEDGYTDDVKLNPLILQRTTSVDYYFGIGGLAQLTARFPKAIRNYDGGNVFEGYGFNFTVADKKVTKIASTLKLPNGESTSSYEF